MKHLKTFLLLILLLNTPVVFGQNSQISASIDRDTVALDDYLTLTVSLQNCESKTFNLPEIPDFELAARPTSQSSMSIINGKKSSSATYTYIFKPKKTGKFSIENIKIKTNDNKELSAGKIKIVVVEKYKNGSAKNRQKQAAPTPQLPMFNPPFGGFPPNPFEQKPTKSKRKTIQI